MSSFSYKPSPTHNPFAAAIAQVQAQRAQAAAGAEAAPVATNVAPQNQDAYQPSASVPAVERKPINRKPINRKPVAQPAAPTTPERAASAESRVAAVPAVPADVLPPVDDALMELYFKALEAGVTHATSFEAFATEQAQKPGYLFHALRPVMSEEERMGLQHCYANALQRGLTQAASFDAFVDELGTLDEETIALIARRDSVCDAGRSPPSPSSQGSTTPPPTFHSTPPSSVGSPPPAPASPDAVDREQYNRDTHYREFVQCRTAGTTHAATYEEYCAAEQQRRDERPLAHLGMPNNLMWGVDPVTDYNYGEASMQRVWYTHMANRQIDAHNHSIEVRQQERSGSRLATINLKDFCKFRGSLPAYTQNMASLRFSKEEYEACPNILRDVFNGSKREVDWGAVAGHVAVGAMTFGLAGLGLLSKSSRYKKGTREAAVSQTLDAINQNIRQEGIPVQWQLQTITGIPPTWELSLMHSPA